MACGRSSRERHLSRNCCACRNDYSKNAKRPKTVGLYTKNGRRTTMLLGAFTIIIMLATAYAFLREGLFTAFTMFFNVFLSGLVAFNFFEPLADRLQRAFAGTFLLGYEDMLCLIGLFCITLGILRLATNTFANAVIDYPEMLQRAGGALFGLATGYLFCGFFL